MHKKKKLTVSSCQIYKQQSCLNDVYLHIQYTVNSEPIHTIMNWVNILLLDYFLTKKKKKSYTHILINLNNLCILIIINNNLHITQKQNYIKWISGFFIYNREHNFSCPNYLSQ